MRRAKSAAAVVGLALVAVLGTAAVAAGQAQEDVSVAAAPWTGPFPPAGANWLPDVVLHDNGPLITHPGGCGGTYVDASRLQTTLGLNTLGFGQQIASGNQIADDFVVPPEGWLIETITFFTYQTSATNVTINDVRVRIWSGAPNAGGTIVWGDLTTNRLAGTPTIGTWQRDSETTTCANNRLIQVLVATVNTTLAGGTYWVEWTVGGTGASGPWAPPVSILGQTAKPGANGLQYTSSSGAWAPAADSGTAGAVQDFPFIIEGSVVPVELQKLTIE